MKCRRLLLMLIVTSGAAAVAQDSVPLAVLPLAVSDFKDGAKHQAVLERAFRDALATELDVAMASAKEVAASKEVLQCTGGKYYDVEQLGRLAFVAGRLYALWTWVFMDDDGFVVSYGKVVRDDGEQVAFAKASVQWLDGKRPYEQAKSLFLRVLGALRLGELPVYRPSAVENCAFSSEFGNRLMDAAYILHESPRSKTRIYRTAYQELLDGEDAKDCRRMLVALERMQRVVSPPAAAPKTNKWDAATVMFDFSFSDYLLRQREALAGMVDGSNPAVMRANDDIDTGFATGDCKRVVAGHAQLRRLAGFDVD